MQVLALHPDVVVARRARGQTTCTLVHPGGELFVVDSPVYQEELESLPQVVQQLGWNLSGLLATHADWDHLLGRLAFPNAALGVAETTSARLRANPGEAQRKLRDHDAEDYVERPRPLSLGDVQTLPVPGRLDIGEQELELLPTGGHTQDGMALWIGWADVLVTGDYVSPVELPVVGHSLSAYRATLMLLQPYVERAAWVVPGHGGPIEGERALALLREDLAYLTALEADGAAAALPLARRSAAMKRIHAENVAALAA